MTGIINRWRNIAASAASRLRERLKRFHFLRTHRIMVAAIAEACRYQPRLVAAQLESEFAQQVDPMGFARECEQVRFHRGLEFIDAARGNAKFKNVLEIGCAEGMFTNMLAPGCEELLAVDISPTALARARARCAGRANVRFAERDLLGPSMKERFDLIAAVGVLEYLQSPGELRAARGRLVEMLEPGGYLLIGTTVRGDAIERSWWIRFLPRWIGIHAFVARHPQLRVVREAVDQAALPFAHMLLRKRGGAAAS